MHAGTAVTPAGLAGRWTVVVAALPPLVLALFAAALAAGAPGVQDWFWPEPTTNIAEAAVLRDGARVRVLAAEGSRLDLALPVEARLADDAPATMTPLEAAVRSRSDEMVQLVLELGATAAAADIQRLHCLAAQLDAAGLQAVLSRETGVPPAPCPQP